MVEKLTAFIPTLKPLGFLPFYCKEIVPQELLSKLSQDALRYYVDEMEKIRDGDKA